MLEFQSLYLMEERSFSFGNLRMRMTVTSSQKRASAEY